jgi:hypothetical protein
LRFQGAQGPAERAHTARIYFRDSIKLPGLRPGFFFGSEYPPDSQSSGSDYFASALRLVSRFPLIVEAARKLRGTSHCHRR